MARATVLVLALLFAVLCFPFLCKSQEEERHLGVVDYSIEIEKEKESWVLAPGVLSFDGTFFHKVIPESVPSLSRNETDVSSAAVGEEVEDGAGTRKKKTNEDFYVSLCVFAAKEPNGEHRGLLFKGSRNEHRTPSMWLLPDSMQVTYRVMVSSPPSPPSEPSSETSSESGALETVESSQPKLPPQEVWSTSRRELPLNAWTHLLLAVGKDLDNDGTSEGSSDEQLKLRLYIDGEVDSEIELPHPPALNPGSLHIGKDISTKEGLTGFISQFEVGQLSSGELKGHNKREKVRGIFRSAMTEVSRITNQWTCDSLEEEEGEGESKALSFLTSSSSAPKPVLPTCPRPSYSPIVKSIGSEPGNKNKNNLFRDNWSLLQDSIKEGEEEEAKIDTLLELAWKNYLGFDNNPKSCDVGLFYMVSPPLLNDLLKPNIRVAVLTD